MVSHHNSWNTVSAKSTHVSASPSSAERNSRARSPKRGTLVRPHSAAKRSSCARAFSSCRFPPLERPRCGASRQMTRRADGTHSSTRSRWFGSAVRCPSGPVVTASFSCTSISSVHGPRSSRRGLGGGDDSRAGGGGAATLAAPAAASPPWRVVALGKSVAVGVPPTGAVVATVYHSARCTTPPTCRWVATCYRVRGGDELVCARVCV